ncbi:MAG: hypothetical protein WEB03_15425 [Nitriliruptor sp.]|uniref:hypothetical protein n=1 Tax=Nitriliruptor sp. TaxID=2448056 RepID=UPI0034A0A1FC
MTFPLVATSDDLAGVSVYLEGTVKALGRRAADLIGARTFDEVWFANAGVVDAEAPGGVVEDPVDQGFWADPAHALIVTPAEVGRSALKNLARRLAPHFSALEPSEDR